MRGTRYWLANLVAALVVLVLLGLHLGIELRLDGKPAADEADRVLYHSLSRGLSYKVGGGCVLTLCPPLTITREQLDAALDIVEAGIESVS